MFSLPMRPIGAALLVVATFTSCRAASTPAPQPVAEAAPTGASASDAPVVPTVGPSSAAALAKARTDSIRLPYTPADIHFMSGMISHHAQAIAMARLVPTRAASNSIRTLALRIINAQQDEIRLMQTWLADRGQVVPAATPMGMKMQMGGMEHLMLMPGMLTPEQVQSLTNARGEDFDRLFLQYMIQHHRGAVSMVGELFGTYGAGQDEMVFKFSSDVNVDQSTEIARMGLMLANMMIQKGSK